MLLNGHLLPDSFHCIVIQLNNSYACTAAAAMAKSQYKTVTATNFCNWLNTLKADAGAGW
jgi:hypothetical protein